MNFLWRIPRRVIQLTCFLGAVVLLWPLLPWTIAPRFFQQLSPFVALSSSIAKRSIDVGAILALAVAVISSFKKRWFCLYLCPTGFLLENSSRFGLRRSGWWGKCPPVGRYVAVLTIIGSIIGYPVLLWMDPLCIFSSPFAVAKATNPISVVLVCLGLGALVGATFVIGMLWCVRICPLSGLQDMLYFGRRALWTKLTVNAPARKFHSARRLFFAGGAGAVLALWARRVGAARYRRAETLLRPPGAVSEDRFTGLCIRCNNCVHACPSKIIRPDTGAEGGLAGFGAPVISYATDYDYCLETCNACSQVCPTGALTPLTMPEKKKYVIGEALVDTNLCLLALGKKECDACELACPYDAIKIKWDEDQYIAYPGINLQKCTGCGACQVVCPTGQEKAIRVWTLKPS